MDVRLRAIGFKLLLSVSLAIAGQSAAAQVMYRMTLISVPYGCSAEPVAEGFNAAGQIAITYCNGQGGLHAWLWKNDGSPTVDLGPKAAQSQSEASGINTSGVVAGDGPDFGFVS